jgi:hypothetical protein
VTSTRTIEDRNSSATALPLQSREFVRDPTQQTIAGLPPRILVFFVVGYAHKSLRYDTYRKIRYFVTNRRELITEF